MKNILIFLDSLLSEMRLSLFLLGMYKSEAFQLRAKLQLWLLLW